ncbi:MAG: class I SAM-dependent methyltransferase [Candidatus Moranbacteria bacterium]|nr:class I SAM-dependent methyltransferase [Candidatus Moranbacteria bacterium]
MEQEPKIANAYKEYYEIYDQVVLKMLPFYSEMHADMTEQIAKEKTENLKILELGFGTGTLTYRIMNEYPNAEVLGVDNHEENIAKATEKLKDFLHFKSLKADFKSFETDELFDAVVSALSIHHLSDQEKQDYFKFIFEKLKAGGRFIIGDLVKSSDEEEWHKYLVDTMGEEGEHRWQVHKGNREDKPSTLEDQLLWLKQAGFDKIEVVNKWFNFYVFYGEKSSKN